MLEFSPSLIKKVVPVLSIFSLIPLMVFAGPPDNGPDGIPPGGRFSVYFTNIIQGNDGVSGACPTDQVIIGFNTGLTLNYGKPICRRMITLPDALTGQTLRNTGTGWVVNSLLYNNGTNIGINTTNPATKLDVNGSLFTRGAQAHYDMSLANAGATQWVKVGTLTAPQNGVNATLRFYGGSGYNASGSQIGDAVVEFRTSNGASVNASGFCASSIVKRSGRTQVFTNIKIVGNATGCSATSYDVYILAAAFIGRSYYTVDTDYGTTWSHVLAVGQADPGVASSTVLIPDFENVINENLSVIGNQTVSGNLGVGTPTPGYKLDVSGTGNFTGLRLPTGAGNTYILTSDASGNARWLANNYVESDPQVGANTTNYLSKWNGTALITSQVFDNGTNVGIGTASPESRFHIYNQIGGIQVDKTLVSIFDLYNTGSNGQYMRILGGNNGFNLISNWGPISLGARGDSSAAMKQDLTILTNGNVGIGTNAPGQKLDVSGGSIRTTNQLISTLATGTAPLAVSSTTVNTNLNADLLDGYTSGNASGNIPLSNGTVNTNLNADMVDGLHVNSTTTNNEVNKIVRTDGSGYANFGWINTTSGDNGTTAISRIYASSDGYIRYYTPANFKTNLSLVDRSAGTLNYIPKWTPDGDTLGDSQIFDNGTNVGIGTAAPGAKLDVNGDLKTYNGSSYNVVRHGSFNLNVGSTGSYTEFISIGTTTSNASSIELEILEDNIGHNVMRYLIPINYDDYNDVNTKIILPLYSSNPRVPTPGVYGGEVLELQKYNSGGVMKFRLLTRYPGTAATPSFYWTAKLKNSNITATSNTTGTDTNTYPIFVTTQLTQNHSGNVGIGTTSPGQKLDVSGGSIRTTNQLISTLATGTAPLAVSSTTVNTNLNADLLDGQHGSYYAPLTALSGTTNYVSKFTGTNSVGNSQIFDNGTNVGIGTASPGAKLDILGSGIPVRITNDVYNDWVLQKRRSDNSQLFGIREANSNGSMSFVTANVDRMTVDSIGNVGIGTASPDSKLDIGGSISTKGSATSRYYDLVEYNNSISVATGTIIITLPSAKHNSNTMLSIKINGYNYNSNGAWSITLGGYNYTTGWVNTSLDSEGRPPFTNVRLGSNGTSNVILLGNTSTIWSYPKVVVSEVIAGHSAYTGWGTGWSTSLATDETGITITATPTFQTFMNASGNVGIGTTSPGQKLDVSGGSIRTTNQLISTLATGTAPLAVSSTTVNTNLNADLLDGYTSGNASGNIPLSNGTVNTNLNADFLDGQSIAYFAPIASPALTGTATAPTAAVGTNTTQLATTEFVNSEIANDAPTKVGGGASGTWGINITGNAATATNSTNATRLSHTDNRIISPSEVASNSLNFGFTSFSNNNTSPYADFIHMRSYGDASGGNDNLLVFNKSSIGARLYQQTFGSVTDYSAYKDFLMTDANSQNATINGDLTVVGKVITDTLVNRTVAQLTVSGSIFPNATSSQKDLGAIGNRWNNLYLTQNAYITGSVYSTAGFVGNVSGNATTATTLQTTRTIGINGKVTGTATGFNGGSNITINTTAVDATTLNSYTQGNASGNIPLSNGTINVNLNADLLDGLDSSRVIYGSNGAGVNTAPTVQTLTGLSMYKAGFWDVNGATWTPDTGWWWGSTLAHSSNSNAYLYGAQMVFQNSLTPQMYIRGVAGGATPAAGSWQKVWTSFSDGAASGLDADLLDGQDSSYYAPIASPALTGTPTAPTAAIATNSTQIATTAFVKNQGYLTGIALSITGTLNIAPIFKVDLIPKGSPAVRTTSTGFLNIQYVYGPFAYSQPTCPAGTTKQYKLFAEFVDNISSGGQNVAFRIALDGGTNLDFNLGTTWGGAPSYRTYLSGLFSVTNANHGYSQIRINGTAGPYVDLRNAEIWTYCIQ